MPVAEGARGWPCWVLGAGAGRAGCWARWRAGRAGRAGVLGALARLRSARRRPECRDHGLAGDCGGSRGRARAGDAVIKDQFMIMDHRAGDRPAGPPSTPARPGNPAVACTAATVPRLARRSGSPGLRRVTRRFLQGRSRPGAGGAGVTASAGHDGGSPGVAYVNDGLLLLSWQLYRGIVAVPGRAGTAETAHRRCKPGARTARAGLA